MSNPYQYTDPEFYRQMIIGPVIFTSSFVACAGLLWLAAQGAQTITSERENDTWISLLSLPATGNEIIYTKIFGRVLSTWPTVLLLGLIWLPPCFFFPSSAMFSFVGTLAVFLILAFFISSMSLSYSLRFSTSLQAMTASLLTLLFIGGGYWLCCLPVAISVSPPPPEEIVAIILAPCMPYLISCPSLLTLWYDRYYKYNWANNDESIGYTLAFFFGVIGYAAAAFLLSQSSALSFDRIAGRTESLGPSTKDAESARPSA